MKFGRPLLIFVAIVVHGMPMASQTPTGTRVEFEAASIKPSKPGDPQEFRGQPGLLTTSAVSLKTLMTFAYGVRDFQIIGGPSWTDTDGWNIVANFKPPAVGTRRPSDAPPPAGNRMVQSLLEDRFQLKIHWEMRDMPIYALTVAKGGPKIKLSEDQTAPRPPDAPPPQPPRPGDPMLRGSILAGPGTLEARAVPMERIIQVVFRQLDRIVVDETGLQGLYDIRLQWNPVVGVGPAADGPEPSGLSIFTAVQEQLGLKLESAKGPVEVVVIDHVERPSEN